jgi:putative alpha-1,2-mannosidase
MMKRNHCYTSPWLTLNGKSFTPNWISDADIMNCGTLHFEMGDKPNTSRGLALEDKSFSCQKANSYETRKNHCRFPDEQ